MLWRKLFQNWVSLLKKIVSLIPSFSTRGLSQAGVNSCSTGHEDALCVQEWFPQDQLKKETQKQKTWLNNTERAILKGNRDFSKR